MNDKAKVADEIEKLWGGRATTLRLKGHQYAVEQAAFFAGAAAAIQAMLGPEGEAKLVEYIPPKWTLCIMASRDVRSTDPLIVNREVREVKVEEHRLSYSNEKVACIPMILLDGPFEKGDNVEVSIELVKKAVPIWGKR